MRHPLYSFLLLLSLLAACSEKHTLPLGDKAKYAAELIDRRAECKVYAQRLALPVNDDNTIQKVYEDAKAAYCIKPDI